MKREQDAAIQTMQEWLSDPSELGRIPAKLEIAGEFDQDDRHYYIFKYKKYLWSKWLMGVCGFEDPECLIPCEQTFNMREPYDPATARAKCKAMVGMICQYGMEQAIKLRAGGPKTPERQSRYEVYTQAEQNVLEDHLKRYFGSCEYVLHEIVSPDIHVDIYVMDPTPERNYYVLSTLGMGAHRMNVPAELAGQQLERAEILVTLPAEWQIKNGDERFYWPLRNLKILARMPLYEDSWLGWGHSIADPEDEPFAGNTKLCGTMLIHPVNAEKEAARCLLPNGDVVNFYQMIPLTLEEIQFKLHNGAQKLLECFAPEQLEVVDIHRASVCENNSVR